MDFLVSLKDKADRLGPHAPESSKTSVLGCMGTIALVVSMIFYCERQLATLNILTPTISSLYPQVSSEDTIILNYTNFAVIILNAITLEDVTTTQNAGVQVSNTSGIYKYALIPFLNYTGVLAYTVNDSVILTNSDVVSFVMYSVCPYGQYKVCITIISDFILNETTGNFEDSNFQDSKTNCVSFDTYQLGTYNIPLTQQSYNRNSGSSSETRSRILTTDTIEFQNYDWNCYVSCCNGLSVLQVNLTLDSTFEQISVNYNSYFTLLSNFGGTWNIFMGTALLIYQIGWSIAPISLLLICRKKKTGSRLTIPETKDTPDTPDTPKKEERSPKFIARVIYLLKQNVDRLGPSDRRYIKASYIGCVGTILLVLALLIYSIYQLVTLDVTTPFFSLGYLQTPVDAVMILNSTNFAINIYNTIPSNDLTNQANPYITVLNSSSTTNYFFTPMNSSYLGPTYTVNESIYLTQNNSVTLTVDPFNRATASLDTAYTLCITILANYRPDPTTGVFEFVNTDSQTNCIPLSVWVQSTGATLQLTQQTHTRTSGSITTNTQQMQRVLPYNDLRFDSYYRDPPASLPLITVTIELAFNFEEIDITYNNYMPLLGNIGGIWHAVVGIATIVFQISWYLIENGKKLHKSMAKHAKHSEDSELKGLLPQKVAPNNLTGDKTPLIKGNGSPFQSSFNQNEAADSLMNGDLSPQIRKSSLFKK